MFEFGLTFGFMAYDLSHYQTNYLLTDTEVIIDWTAFGVFSVIAVFNNIHGHNILRTTEGSFNTKFYFFTRFVLQCAVIYVCVCLISGRNLTWGPKLPNPDNQTS
jgi:tetrahydromethanopterin S-methyltransferase subunit D